MNPRSDVSVNNRTLLPSRIYVPPPSAGRLIHLSAIITISNSKTGGGDILCVEGSDERCGNADRCAAGDNVIDDDHLTAGKVDITDDAKISILHSVGALKGLLWLLGIDLRRGIYWAPRRFATSLERSAEWSMPYSIIADLRLGTLVKR